MAAVVDPKGCLTVALLLLAGCASTAPLDDTATDLPDVATAPDVPLPVTPPPAASLQLNATDCSSLVTVVVRPLATVQGVLPAGYTARDAAQLIHVDAATGYGAFIIAWSGCAAATNETGAVELGVFGVYVEAPTLDVTSDRYEHFLVLDQWGAWPGLTSWAAAWDWPIAAGGAALDVVADGRTEGPAAGGERLADPGPSAMTMSIATPATAALDATAAGGTGYAMKNRVFRFWAQTGNNTVWLDIAPDRDGTSGAVDCQYGTQAEYAQWTGESRCGETLAVSMAIPAYTMTASTMAGPRA